MEYWKTKQVFLSSLFRSAQPLRVDHDPAGTDLVQELRTDFFSN